MATYFVRIRTAHHVEASEDTNANALIDRVLEEANRGKCEVSIEEVKDPKEWQKNKVLRIGDEE